MSMTAKNLSERDNWQKYARIIGDAGEDNFVSFVAKYLPGHYNIVYKPPKLAIYSDGRGIKLDSMIVNTKTGKRLYVENKTGNNGGNAHERAYKFISEPLKDRVRENHHGADEPFFLIFSGETFQGQKYQDELNLLLEGNNYAIIEPHYANIEQVAKQIVEIV
tara:strand:+ start:1426 stop:1914 length:489 start_codon:yes stop_codon:yes gene_type:complete